MRKIFLRTPSQTDVWSSLGSKIISIVSLWSLNIHFLLTTWWKSSQWWYMNRSCLHCSAWKSFSTHHTSIIKVPGRVVVHLDFIEWSRWRNAQGDQTFLFTREDHTFLRAFYSMKVDHHHCIRHPSGSLVVVTVCASTVRYYWRVLWCYNPKLKNLLTPWHRSHCSLSAYAFLGSCIRATNLSNCPWFYCPVSTSSLVCNNVIARKSFLSNLFSGICNLCCHRLRDYTSHSHIKQLTK
jgi:hypothetical protein